MGQEPKKLYLSRIRARYHKASKQQKSIILDEFCLVCGHHRKHAIRLLKDKPTRRKKLVAKSKAGRKPIYNRPPLTKALKRIWIASDYMCGKRLKAALPEWLPHYSAYYEPLDEETYALLQSISAASIDRLLKPSRAKLNGRGLSGTKPGSLIKNQIPIKTNHWDVSKPGFLEADTVAHCGNSLAGNFVWSLTMTDILTCWTECRATWNKGAHGVCKQVNSIEQALPFPILGFDCDNGSEFLNYHLIRYFTDRPKERMVQFTRSRPYHKDDNAHVEQKNWTHVRQCFGYDRIDNQSVVALMNDLYANEWSLLQNHFCPTLKLLSKTKINSKYKKTYDEPQTPYQRLINSKSLNDNAEKALIQTHNSLNPFQLKNIIEMKLKHIFKLISVTSNVRQRI
jgi:hypothetical protein